MEFRGIPTSKDIYLEADGRKIAVVQSYLASATQEITPIEAFGTVNPVEIIRGKINKTIIKKSRTTTPFLSDALKIIAHRY